MHTMNTLIDLSLTVQESVEVDCNITLNIEGQSIKAYAVSVSYRDVMFYTDCGYVTYLVDSYGDRDVAVLHDWELYND